MDKYEEALEKAWAEYEKAREQGYTWLMGLLEGMFPDLKESEDERIRKAIMEVLKRVSGATDVLENQGTTFKKAMIWLEKQKDLDKMIVVSPEVWEKAIDDAYEDGKRDSEKQKEQKPAEWSEDWREEDVQTRFAFYTYKDDPSVLYLSNVFVEEMSRNHGFGTRILRAAEKVAEAIGATTISLKVKQNSPANAWYRKNGYGYVAFEDGYDWLEKNLEYMKPNKQEWSEEDEKHIEALFLASDRCMGKWHCCNEQCEISEHLDWLKSLPLNLKKKNENVAKLCSNEWSEKDKEMLGKVLECIRFAEDRYQLEEEQMNGVSIRLWLLDHINPQPHWKPSEEQMGTLKKWLQDHELDGDSRDVYPIFYSLFADLQKLL